MDSVLGKRGYRTSGVLVRDLSGSATYQASGIQSINRSAFLGTNPTGELITVASGEQSTKS
jgi:hypothetical protein